MPTRETAWPAGTPCWVDYGAADVEAARGFYADVLGWTYAGGEPEHGGYLSCLTRGLQAAGMAPQQDPSDPPRWTTCFATDDVEENAGRAVGAGGTVVAPPMDVGPMGRMALVLDPQGNPFGLWQAGQHIGAEVYGEPGALVWNEAAVDDPEAARRFYRDVFGFRYQVVEGVEGYTTFATGDRPLGRLGAAQPGLPTGWSTCFAVASTDRAVDAVRHRGGSVLVPAQDTPFGRFAVVRDPWGAAFSVMQGAGS